MTSLMDLTGQESGIVLSDSEASVVNWSSPTASWPDLDIAQLRRASWQSLDDESREAVVRAARTEGQHHPIGRSPRVYVGSGYVIVAPRGWI